MSGLVEYLLLVMAFGLVVGNRRWSFNKHPIGLDLVMAFIDFLFLFVVAFYLGRAFVWGGLWAVISVLSYLCILFHVLLDLGYVWKRPEPRIPPGEHYIPKRYSPLEGNIQALVMSLPKIVLIVYFMTPSA